MANIPPPVFGPQSPARFVATRDLGTRSVSRLTRWVVAGSFGVATVLSIVAASAFSGHTHSGSSAGRAPANPGRVVVAIPPRQEGGVSAPIAPPVVAPPAAPPVSAGGPGQVVSGGS